MKTKNTIYEFVGGIFCVRHILIFVGICGKCKTIPDHDIRFAQTTHFSVYTRMIEKETTQKLITEYVF
jgi:hypothetical protein